MAGQTIERRLRGEEGAEASEEQERRESGAGEEEGRAGARCKALLVANTSQSRIMQMMHPQHNH